MAANQVVLKFFIEVFEQVDWIEILRCIIFKLFKNKKSTNHKLEIFNSNRDLHLYQIKKFNHKMAAGQSSCFEHFHFELVQKFA